MSIGSMLIENNYIKDTKDYNRVHSQFDKVQGIISDMSQEVIPCTRTSANRALDILYNYKYAIKGDLGNCDIWDLYKFLDTAFDVFSKKLIRDILRKVVKPYEFNPKSNGKDKKVLDPYLKMIDELNKTLEL